MKYIPLTQGKQAIVDDADYPSLSQYKWQYHYGYAKRDINCIRLHRQILKAPKYLEVDHINGNKLDCRRQNMRLCTRTQNNRNVGKRRDSKQLYRGIVCLKNRGQWNRWAARIQVNNKRMVSGYFDNQLNAAQEYDRLAKDLHREFARLNFPA